MKKIIALVLALVMCLCLFAACGNSEETPAPADTSKPADTNKPADTATPSDDPFAGLEPVEIIHANAGAAAQIELVYTEKWMELVTERTNGLVTFDYTSGGAMGSYADLLDGVNNGAYHMTMTDLSMLEPYAPEVGVLSLPFLASDYDHLQKIWASDAFTWLQDAVSAKTDMVLLNAFFCGFREVLSVDELKTVDDFKGYLIRVPQIESYTKVFDALDFSYTTLAWSECYTALQTGVVNACEDAMMSMVENGFYDLAKYVTLTHHMQATNGMVVNKTFWESLPEAYRTVMIEALEEMREAEWAECIANEDYYMKELESHGVTINDLSDADRAKMKEMVADYWDEVIAKVGGDAASIVEDCLALQ